MDCWISGKYQNTRLWTHYMWIFISQFGCVVLYTILFFYLRRKVALSASLTQPSREKLFRLKRVVTLMILYPLAYLFLSMPIAAGRMAVASGMKLSFVYVLSAACIMVTSGIVHAVIYTITRKSLILSSTPISNHISQHGASTRKEISGSHTDEESDVGTPVTSTFATGPPPPSSRSVGKYEKMCRRFNGSVSLGNGTRRLSSSGADEIVELNETGVYQQTTISVTHEPMPPIAQTRDGASSIGASINDTRPMSSRVFPKKQ
ncbi:hypothetical protein FQN49_007598 [Arthroderma sp. PD_2]|nr:hypothetical protein FQN49_007598 [Arthroderma sp. PD_2]